MVFGEIIIVALQSIRANLFRAALTMLGIIIGVGAVITMLAAGAGAQKRIDDQIAALGANIEVPTIDGRALLGDQNLFELQGEALRQARARIHETLAPSAGSRGLRVEHTYDHTDPDWQTVAKSTIRAVKAGWMKIKA